MIHVEEVCQRDIASLHKIDFQHQHETADGEPEIVSHHHDALHPSSVTLPKGLHQLRIVLVAFGVQPLLELVDDD